MPTPSSRSLLSRYLMNAIHTFGNFTEANCAIFEWMYDNKNAIGFDLPDVTVNNHDFNGTVVTKKIAKEIFKEIHDKTIRWGNKCKKSILPRSYNVLSHLADFYSLNDTERDILCLAYLFTTNKHFERLCNSLEEAGLKYDVILGALLKESPRVISHYLSKKSTLIMEGLVEKNTKYTIINNGIGIHIDDSLLDLCEQPIRNINDITLFLVGKPTKSELRWNDFEHIGQQRAFIADLIKGANSSKEKGINILVHGAPGTGKTEFCKVLSRHLGLKLFSVGENDDDGEEASRSKRLSLLRMAQHLLSHQNNVAILFDEMEDIIASPAMGFLSMLTGQPSNNAGSKVFQNHLLDTNQLPTFWTTNSITHLDEAYLRRMTFVLEMKAPPRQNRLRIWKRHLKKNKINISNTLLDCLADNPKLTPAIASSAARSIRMAGRPASEIEHIISGYAKAMGINFSLPDNHQKNSSVFSMDLISANLSAQHLQRLTQVSDIKNPSFCLYGPPGTGKSAYARHIAQQLGLPVIEKRLSEILSKYVGESEKNISDAFAEAKESGSVLIFDEADSLLFNRRQAVRSWERNLVSELLICMEHAQTPFICTTNMFDQIDAASLRRFDHKIKFGYLSCQQAAKAFTLYFKKPAPKCLNNLKTLTPGDFKVVDRRCSLLGVRNVNEIYHLLAQECEHKPDQTRAIGFIS